MISILKYPLSTEKSVKLVGTANTITFVVGYHATKKQIRKAFEALFKVKVLKVNTLIHKGRKKAYIKLAQENPAADVAAQFGMM